MAITHARFAAAVLMTFGIIGVATSAAAQEQPPFTTIRAEFVPGERTIFFDDFSDMIAGAAPSHFRVRGAAPELSVSGTLRQLTFTRGGVLIPNLTALPANFTYESEVQLVMPGGRGLLWLVLFSGGREAAAWRLQVRPNEADVSATQKLPTYVGELGRGSVRLDLSQPVRLAMWLQDGRLRLFVNGTKHVDANQVNLPAIDRVEIRTDLSGEGLSAGYRWVRFAESAPDFSSVIAASGRYVSYGIRFDTDSDRLRPESGPALQAVANALQANPDLRLLIEGHTDAVGDAAHNLDLSRRRAEAVKAVLTTQFTVDTARLTTAGVGSTRPIEPNTTPQGRAQNRRVEFVRQ
jgi:outer membrane protein OmpA-like peptidoglycan-associated protein